jgi:xanthine dehydrogenase large subunit
MEVNKNTRNIERSNIDAQYHVSGKSIYLDDIPTMAGTVFLKIIDSTVAHGKIKSIDFSAAAEVVGVVRIFAAADIPGENQIGGIIADEPLLADGEVHFCGQPILIIAADSQHAAYEAAQLVKIEIEPLPIITCPREASEKGHILSPSRKFNKGDANAAFKRCKYVFAGKADSGGQEHLYLETQGAYAYPTEHKSIKIHSSTQGPTAVQRTIARVLGLGMHQIEIDVARLGGGFGGKEDQASGWAAMAALVAHLLQRPAKCVLHRMDDMRMTGKRNPYSSNFKIGLDNELKIIAYQASFFQNGGAAADLSPAILERTLFHATNAYAIANVDVIAHSCRTNLPPNTAFRGFGGPQGMFVIEAAIDYAARQINVPASEIQARNLISDGYEFSYGQVVKNSEANTTWNALLEKVNIGRIKKEIASYNESNPLKKKGLSFMPICFGISFTNTMMNHARALLHVYSDGSVGISTGAVEMGQGVNTKMLLVAQHCLGIDRENIKVETTNTTRVANTSPTAASAGADLNGNALLDACRQIIDRLRPVAQKMLDLPEDTQITFSHNLVYADGKPTQITWKALINAAFVQRVNLSAKGHYATPDIHFDKNLEKGHPFAYHVYGTAMTIATVDCLRGTYTIDSVDIMHDFGESISPEIDLGQVEGGLVQGIGWVTMEEIIYNEQGRLLTNALSTYKIPDIYAVPKAINVHYLETENNNLAVLKSKAVGEPPLMYGIGAFFAIFDAARTFNPKMPTYRYNAPITPEKLLAMLYS